MRNRLLIFTATVCLSLAGAVMAQDFDDIYFDSSKSTKKAKNVTPEFVTEEASDDEYSDSPVFGNNYIAERDVDEYNRRGSYSADADTTTYANDSVYAGEDSFQYTDRIKRFHNPSVVIESTDPDLVNLYVYTRPSVNIVVGTPTYTTWATDPYYYSSVSWGFYNSWYPFGYVGWGYDPFYFSFYDPFYYSYRPYWHHHHYSYWYPMIPYWGGGCVPTYGGWHGHSLAHNPSRYRGASGTSRRTVGTSTGIGTRRPASSSTTSRGSRIGEIVSNRPSTVESRPSGGATTGVTRGGTIRSKQGGSTTRSTNNGNSGFYRRPNSSSSSNTGVQRSNTSTQRSSFSSDSYYNGSNRSSSSSFNSGSYNSGRSSSGSSGGVSRGGSGRRH